MTFLTRVKIHQTKLSRPKSSRQTTRKASGKAEIQKSILSAMHATRVSVCGPPHLERHMDHMRGTLTTHGPPPAPESELEV